MKIRVLSLFLLLISIVFFIDVPHNNTAISESVNSNSACPHCTRTNISNTTQITTTPYKPFRLQGVTSAKNITTLRTTDANVAFLQLSASYNYQYVTWTESFGRNNVIFVASSSDGGHTFHNTNNLSSAMGDSSNARFVASLDRMYGVFVQHLSAKNDIIKFARTSDGGIHWNTSTLADPSGIVEELSIALQGNQVSVAWSNSDNVTTVNHYVVNG